MLHTISENQRHFSIIKKRLAVSDLEKSQMDSINNVFRRGRRKGRPDRRNNVPKSDIFVEIIAFNKGRISFNRAEQFWKPVKATELFFYLLMHRNLPVSIETIGRELWPDSRPENGIRNVRKTMMELRSHLKMISREQIKIIYLNGTYNLTCYGCYYDVEQFEKAYELSTKWVYEESQAVSSLIYLQELYEGAFLNKNNWTWASDYRESLREKFFIASVRLSKILIQQGDFNKLSQCYDKLIKNGFFNHPETKIIRSVLKDQDPCVHNTSNCFMISLK